MSTIFCDILSISVIVFVHLLISKLNTFNFNAFKRKRREIRKSQGSRQRINTKGREPRGSSETFARTHDCSNELVIKVIISPRTHIYRPVSPDLAPSPAALQPLSRGVPCPPPFKYFPSSPSHCSSLVFSSCHPFSR